MANKYGGMIGGSIAAGQNAGFFDPMGSPAIRAALKRRAMRTAANQRRRGTVLNRLLGLGPQEQRQAMLDVDREASSGLANTLNEGEYNQLASGQNWLRQMLGQERGYEHEKSMQPGIGATLGQIGGMGLGALIGGPMGASVGGQLGGMAGGAGKRPQKTDYDYTTMYG